MNAAPKQFIAIISSLFIIFIIGYGTYLPYEKSTLFIDFLGSLRNVKSVIDFENNAKEVLDYPSPMGQEELVRNFGNVVLNVLKSNQNPALSLEVLRFLKIYLDPIVARGRGINFSQNLLLIGQANELVYDNTHQDEYLKTAENYFREGLSLSPRRPQFLESLLGVYTKEKKIKEATEVENQIATYWPWTQAKE